MTDRLTVARWRWDESAPVWSATASYSTWRASHQPYRSYEQQLSDRIGYQYVWEDLVEIAASAQDWPDGEIPPSQSAIRSVSDVISQTADVLPPPEITARETGTILILWPAPEGFMSLEVGTETFGLLGSRHGYPSLRVNGALTELQRYLPHRRTESLSAGGQGQSSWEQRALAHWTDGTAAISREGVPALQIHAAT